MSELMALHFIEITTKSSKKFLPEGLIQDVWNIMGFGTFWNLILDLNLNKKPKNLNEIKFNKKILARL